MNIDHDLIKAHWGKLDSHAIEKVEGFVWRSSQHKTMEEAEANGSYMTTDVWESHTSAVDALYGMCSLANLMDNDAEQFDIMIRLTINGEDQEPCFLDDATWVIDLFLIRKGYLKSWAKPLTTATQPA